MRRMGTTWLVRNRGWKAVCDRCWVYEKLYRSAVHFVDETVCNVVCVWRSEWSKYSSHPVWHQSNFPISCNLILSPLKYYVITLYRVLRDELIIFKNSYFCSFVNYFFWTFSPCIQQSNQQSISNLNVVKISAFRLQKKNFNFFKCQKWTKKILDCSLYSNILYVALGHEVTPRQSKVCNRNATIHNATTQSVHTLNEKVGYLQTIVTSI
jgi:hypothetical protein